MKERLIESVLYYVSDKISEQQLSDLKLLLYYELSDYEVTKKCTAVAVQDLTYMDYLRKYLMSLKMSGKSDKTLEQYNIQLSFMLHDVNKRIEEITTDDLFNHLAKCKRFRQVGNRYLNQKRIVFNGFFGWLQKKKYLSENPAISLDQIKWEKKIKKPYSDEEREALRCACRRERDLAMIDLLYSTGMRVGELVRLNRCDIHWDSQDCVVFGKGAKEREVYLNASSCYHLRKYLAERTDDNPALFVSVKSPFMRLSEHGVRQALSRLGLRANVEHVHPHRYRTTAATNALSRGMPIQDVQAMLGHESIDTTMIYCCVNRDNIRISHRKYLSA